MERKRAYTWVMEAKMYREHEAMFTDEMLHDMWYVTLHGADCDRQKHKGEHFHIVVWPRDHVGSYSDTRIVRKFRAMDPYKENWDYQRVKNLQSILLYVTHKEKTFHHSQLDDRMQAYINDLPQQARDRMDTYVDERDKDKKINLEGIVNLMTKHRAHNLNVLLNTLAKNSHKDINNMELLTRITGHPRITQLERQANDIIRKQNATLPYDKHLQQFEDTYNPDQYETVEQTRVWIKKILEHNHIDYTETCQQIAKIMLKQGGKRNCLWITGPSNAGKSVFTRSIVDAVPTHGQLLASTDFMFQDCQDVPIIYSEETRITTDVVSDFKKVMEGTMIHANKKYKDTYELHQTPMVCCSNERPDQNCATESQAIRNRMLYLEFNIMPELKQLKKKLNPLFWLHKVKRELRGEEKPDGAA